MSGKLFLVPTPIGNLEDITYRAIRVLNEVSLILAEDTRTTAILLKHYQISKPLQSYHVFNEHQTVLSLTQRLKEGQSFALVSEAGTPSISDPGFLLVRACLEQHIIIECLPGATAFVPALVNSGLPTDRFVFEGFLPHKKGRQTRIKNLAQEPRTIVLYESPHRLLKAIEQFIEVMGENRRCAISRELTKIHEENFRGTLKEAHTHFTKQGVKGEIVIIIAGSDYEYDQSRTQKDI